MVRNWYNMPRKFPALKLTIASVATLSLAIVGYVLLGGSAASAKDPLGRIWPDAQMLSMDDIDHAQYDALLKKYVDDDGLVNYSAWRNSQTDRQALQAYLTTLSSASPRASASRAAQLAFWINAYNAVTLEGILQVYPTDSIRKHTSRLGGFNIWKHLPLLVGGKAYSLNGIEHEILRKMDEPRIHFAIVCASVGCPRLRNEAYTATQLDEQLADNTRDFFSRSQNLQLQGNTLHLSAILDWFGSDFGKGLQQQLASLQPYLPADAQQAAATGGAQVKYLDYDWSLNDQSQKKTQSRRGQ